MRFLAATAALAFLLVPQTASAQSAATQALSACVLRSATADDDITLSRWLFIAMSRHPSVAQFASVSDSQRVDANRQMGALVNRVVLDACANETRAALAADGEAAIEAAFAAFGRRAMSQIMGNPDVNAGVVEMSSYIDGARLHALQQQPQQR